MEVFFTIAWITVCAVGALACFFQWRNLRPEPEPDDDLFEPLQDRVWVNWNEPALWVEWAERTHPVADSMDESVSEE
jgi:hypothetical protein